MLLTGPCTPASPRCEAGRTGRVPHPWCGNRKTGTIQRLTWHSARFLCWEDIQLLSLAKVTSFSYFTVDSSYCLLVQSADTHRIREVYRYGWDAVGVRLRLEKNVQRTSASNVGGSWTRRSTSSGLLIRLYGIGDVERAKPGVSQAF
jgi:hypothetical protein